jgi:CDP-glucose 4,6-dehydratase
MADTLATFWGDSAKWQVSSGQHPHEATHLKLDISKAEARLGWHPSISLQTALELVIDWAKARNSGVDMKQFTLDQIRAYQSIAS